MSINSPTKQERIERHLMRQRGAGFPSISTIFNFSFGDTACTSRKTNTSSAEPPTKQRKTILDAANVADQVAFVSENGAPTVKAKRRKRLDLTEEDAGATAAKAARDAEDSFIAGLGRATKKTNPGKGRNKSASESVVDDLGNQELVRNKPAQGWRKRTAAAAAAALITEGFAEEAAPIDNKRHRCDSDSRPEDAVPVSALFAENIGKSSHPEDPAKASEKPPSEPRPVARARKKRAPSSRVTKDIKQPRTLELLDENLDKSPLAAPEETKCRQTKHCKQTKQDVDELLPYHGSRTSNKRAQADDMVHSERQDTAPKPVGKKQHAAKSNLEERREPLKPTDGNIARLSVSPLKSDGNHDTARHALKHHKPTKQTAAKATTRTKVDKETGYQNDIAKSHNVEPTRKAHKTSGKPTEKAQKLSQSTQLTDVTSKDEDIDWLFEPKTVLFPAATGQKAKKPTQPTPKSRKRAQDIDLDDLLSNIASFASKEKGIDAMKGDCIAPQTIKQTTRRK